MRHVVLGLSLIAAAVPAQQASAEGAETAGAFARNNPAGSLAGLPKLTAKAELEPLLLQAGALVRF